MSREFFLDPKGDGASVEDLRRGCIGSSIVILIFRGGVISPTSSEKEGLPREDEKGLISSDRRGSLIDSDNRPLDIGEGAILPDRLDWMEPQ